MVVYHINFTNTSMTDESFVNTLHCLSLFPFKIKHISFPSNEMMDISSQMDSASKKEICFYVFIFIEKPTPRMLIGHSVTRRTEDCLDMDDLLS